LNKLYLGKDEVLDQDIRRWNDEAHANRNNYYDEYGDYGNEDYGDEDY